MKNTLKFLLTCVGISLLFVGCGSLDETRTDVDEEINSPTPDKEISNNPSTPKQWPDDDYSLLNHELFINNEDGTKSKTKNKLAIGSKKSYPIGSVFVGGGIADPREGSSHRCHFYQDSFTEGPCWDKVASMIYISGFRYKGTEYTIPGQYIDRITIITDDLGFGKILNIPMNQGKYEGGCDLVKDVKINSYKFSTYKEDYYTINDDANIDIRILMKDGTVIAILFAGTTPFDGYV
jgi:hypothetical protein